MSGPMAYDQPTSQPGRETRNDSALPSRLREKLEKREESHRRERHGPPSLGFIMLTLLLTVTVVGFLWWRSNEMQRQSITSAAPTATIPVAPDVTTYGIGVGTFASEDAAIAERDRLSASTDLPGVIERITVDGSTTYRVILGSYETPAAAESAATPLAKNYVVRAWQVVPMRTGG